MGVAQADIPTIISYQGKVTDSGGRPVADGTYTMRFWIYDAATGGTSPWNSGAQSVYVSGGVFNVLLGESPQPEIDLPFDEDYWLLVRFNGVNQTPRQRLASVGYAYLASGLVPGTEVSGAVTSDTSSAFKGTNLATAGSNFGVFGANYSTEGSAVYGSAYATSGTTNGVYGESSSTSGRGVYGFANATSGSAVGVYGESSSTSGKGVYAEASGTGLNYGVWAVSSSTRGYGVSAWASSGTGITYGVKGEAYSTDGHDVYGRASAVSGTTYGVYGKADSPNGYGVYYEGGLEGTGLMRSIVMTSQGPTGLSLPDTFLLGKAVPL